jgi:Suppressor of fused protein (SUFU)
VLDAVQRCYQEHFAAQPARASVAFVGVDTIEILRFADPLGQAYLTLGMSQYAMADPTAPVRDEQTDPRAELMVTAVHSPDLLYRQLALLAAVPAVEGTVYHEGDRVQLDEPLVPESRCVGGLLVSSGLGPVEANAVAPVQILQVLPATAEELAFARVHGNPAVIQLWQEQATPLRDLMRAAARLS